MIDTELRPEEWLSLLARWARDLRESGITHVQIGGVSFGLAPWAPVESKLDEPARHHDNSDPLFDSATFAGGKVPGYHLDDHEDEDS